MSSNEETIKIITLGESSVGKTSILAKYVDEIFDINVISTLGVDFKRKVETIDGRQINIKVWDTAGQECFRNIQKIYYHNTEGVLLVFDLTNKKTFEQLNYWISSIKAECPGDVAVCLVGNKADLIDKIEVNDIEIEDFCKNNNNLKYFCSSAVNGKNIKEIFQYISREILKIMDKKKGSNNTNKNITMTKNKLREKKKSRC
jgi:small GTP-binding protein